MPYPNGTPTAEEHAEKAAEIAERGEGLEVSTEAYVVVQAINGLTHAVLALVRTVEDLPERMSR